MTPGVGGFPGWRPCDPRPRIEAALDRIAAVDRPEVWISVRRRDNLLAEAALVHERLEASERLPLAGLLVAVKDNIDVAGLATTAAAPTYRHHPATDATAVARLRALGAIVVGKTNLDQFATGLVGTRSPYGAVRNAWDPARISGGSSSGSAVAVALGLVDVALGTDTAGSGRVPAALNGVVGIKPTRGRIPVTGVVPACRSLDCITVFARDLRLGRSLVEAMAGVDDADPFSRAVPIAAPAPIPRVAVPTERHLEGMARGWREAFAGVVARLRDGGAEIIEVDVEPLLAAARLLYDGAFVAERYAAVGAHIEAHRHRIGCDLDPSVAQIVLAAAGVSAAQWAADTERLQGLAVQVDRLFAGVTALLTPTTTAHPTLAEVDADPIGVNAALGRFTNAANLLDLAALAVPGSDVDGLPFGVMFTGPAGSDLALDHVAEVLRTPAVELFVVGAHLSGQPLNRQLVEAGGTLVATRRTASSYRLFALDTVPPKPGLVRTAGSDAGKGAAIEGEVWRLPADGFGRFVAAIPAPMAIGTVTLDDGSAVSGFLVEPAAVADAEEITRFGGWRAYRRHVSEAGMIPA